MYLEKFPYNIPIKSKKYPESIPAFIEVSQGSRMKYEWCHKKKSLELDRVLHSAVFYPHNYGFIPQTLCDDGDPLDVLNVGKVYDDFMSQIKLEEELNEHELKLDSINNVLTDMDYVDIFTVGF